MKEHITVVGNAATSPEVHTLPSGDVVANFRLAATERKFIPDRKEWADGGTNWFSVRAYGALGTHLAASVQKGQQIIVVGKLIIQQWQKDDRKGTTVLIDAEAAGVSLRFGTASFARDSAGAAPAASAADAETPQHTESDALAQTAWAGEHADATPF